MKCVLLKRADESTQWLVSHTVVPLSYHQHHAMFYCPGAEEATYGSRNSLHLRC